MSSEYNISHIDSLILIAGLSGAGKSSVQNALEDHGYLVVDNLPVALFSSLIESSRNEPEKYKRTALLMLVDSTSKQEALLLALKKLEAFKNKTEIIFLDCSTSIIIKRYSETRRPHPGFAPSRDGRLKDAIERERSRLAPIKELANLVIDTSTMNVHELRRRVGKFVENLPRAEKTSLRVNFTSFGFKYGLPRDCDLVADVRFLKNPYFVSELKEKTGLQKEVQDYVLKEKEAREFLTKYSDLLNFLIPNYIHEGKAYLNIGVGCTGGKHRSVTIAKELKKATDFSNCVVSVIHRDVEK